MTVRVGSVTLHWVLIPASHLPGIFNGCPWLVSSRLGDGDLSVNTHLEALSGRFGNDRTVYEHLSWETNQGPPLATCSQKTKALPACGSTGVFF